MKKYLTFLILISGVFASVAGADEITLSGVDSRLTPVTGLVNLYAVVTDASGKSVANLGAGDFIIREIPGDEALTPESFSPAGERKDGIVFMMLIDDSGSMYGNPGGDRAALARREAGNFLDNLGNSLDRAGLALFGTHYRVLAGPRTDRASIYEQLEDSSPPEPEKAYTELYAAVREASLTLSREKGRRIVILFSDGENYPFFQQSGKEHPDYGERIFTGDDALEALQAEGITLYAVRFGPNRDEVLARIARSTGGLVFDVNAEEELSGLYSLIRERVLAEYRLGYRPRLTGAEETAVRVELAAGASSAVLTYPSGVVFGEPSSAEQALLSLLSLPFIFLILFVLARLWKRKPVESASLERLRPVGAGAQTVVLESGRTIISPGGAGEAGGTTTIISEGSRNSETPGKPQKKAPGKKSAPGASAVQNGGTIIVEKGRDGHWRISSDEGVVVNNRKFESTVLENGDVIKAGEELIVFDDGES